MEMSRTRKVEHFYSLVRANETLLDVGVSAEGPGGSRHRNYFLKTFRLDPCQYTGLGIQDLKSTQERFPGFRFVRYAGGRFPFEDKQFDWVFSNAVIEHVGDESAQIAFVNEMLRVAHRVYFTTPYKFFPVEAHTNLLLVHWSDALFRRWMRRTWPGADPHAIFLLSRRRLARVMRASNAAQFNIVSNRLFGLVMTMTIICSDSADACP